MTPAVSSRILNATSRAEKNTCLGQTAFTDQVQITVLFPIMKGTYIFNLILFIINIFYLFCQTSKMNNFAFVFLNILENHNIICVFNN